MSSDVFTIPDHPRVVADLEVSARATFLTRTYLHLFGAILGFVAVEAFLFGSGIADRIARTLLGTSYGFLTALGAFMIVGWIASRAAHTVRAPATQYLALAGFVVAEALIFVPLLWIADEFAPGAIESAAVITLVGFTGLTAVVLLTRKDFSFLKGILGVGSLLAIGLIVVGAISGFGLGLWFSVAMVALASGAVLYDTSNVLHHYPVDRHVGAALELFASVALLFWYVLRIVIALQNE